MKLIKVKEMVYIAQSEEKGESQNYMVNLRDNHNQGSCTCSHFKFRILPKWRRGDKINPCKHILMSLGSEVWHKINH
jgi:hypothetical protein